MKTIITVLLILIAFTVSARKYKDYKIGYYIVIENSDNKKQVVKTENITEVAVLLQNTINWVDVNTMNLEAILEYKRYIELEDDKSYFYGEVKRINKRGKYKRIKNSNI